MKQILIVDDFEPGRIALRERLQILGYVCQEVSNGLEALEALKTTHFDLVITDNKMPVMTGLEFVQSLAQQPPAYKPPIILLTGHPSPSLNDAARQAGARKIFQKPFDDQEFFLEIKNIVESG